MRRLHPEPANPTVLCGCSELHETDVNLFTAAEVEPAGPFCAGAGARMSLPRERPASPEASPDAASSRALRRKEWIEPGCLSAVRLLELDDQKGGTGRGGHNLPVALYHCAVAPFLYFDAPLPNQLYVFGGRNEEQEALATVEMFDTWHGRWVTCPEMSRRRAGCAAAPLPNGTILVAGGYDERGIVEGLLQTCEVFDPVAQRWSEARSSLTRARWGHGCITLDGKLYAVGGCSLRCGAPPEEFFMETLRDCEVYDPEEDTWSICSPLNTPRAGARIVALGGSFMAAVGGCDDVFGRAEILASIELFDAHTGLWSTLETQLQEPRTTAAVAALDDREILIFGGAPSLSSCEVFGVPEQDKIPQFAGATPQRPLCAPPICDVTEGRMGCQAIALDLPAQGESYPLCSSRCVVVVGGENGDEDWDGFTRHFDSILVYDIAENIWRSQDAVPPIPTPRTALALCVAPGRLFGQR